MKEDKQVAETENWKERRTHFLQEVVKGERKRKRRAMDVKVEFRAGCDERKVHQELVSAARTADMPQPADAS